MRNARLLHLWQLKTLINDTFCCTVATIDSIKQNNGWFYASANETFDPVMRYKVETSVSHEGVDSTFVLWDRKIIQLIGQTAGELRKRQIDEGDLMKQLIPEPLDDILDKTYAFRLMYWPQYKQGSVLQISEDQDLIKEISSKLIGPQVEEKGKKVSPSCSQPPSGDS